MTLTLELTPQESAWLDAQAQQQGRDPADIVKRLIDAHAVAMPVPAATAQLMPVLDAKQQAAIAYLDARIAEGENATPEQVRQATEEFEELKRNLNANRASTGERLVFP